MSMFFKKSLQQAMLCVVTTLAVAGCASNGGDLSPAGRVATSVSVVSHYGKGISITDSYLNGGYIGIHDGWGGGGATQCCVSLRSSPSQPTMVTVKWKTSRDYVDEERWHEETVPVHFAESDVGFLFVHLLPGHKVEVWSSAKTGAGNPAYPGPKYPHKPAPDYVPLPDEKPNPTKVN